MNNFKGGNILVSMLFLLFFGKMNAQNISVTDFYQEEDKSLYAMGRIVKDVNGEQCALIRVKTKRKDFQFDGGSASIMKIEDNHDGEIRLWVTTGIKSLSISHHQFGALNYDFPIKIRKAFTYIMNITHDDMFVENNETSKKQKVFIKITPPNAVLLLNGTGIGLNVQGEAIREMPHGKFIYRVYADKYYPIEGLIVVDDQNNSLIINELKPITGNLSLHVNPICAEILVDDSIVKHSVLKPVKLQIGEHKIRISANGYKSETRVVNIEENLTNDISVTLSRIVDF